MNDTLQLKVARLEQIKHIIEELNHLKSTTNSVKKPQLQSLNPGNTSPVFMSGSFAMP